MLELICYKIIPYNILQLIIRKMVDKKKDREVKVSSANELKKVSKTKGFTDVKKKEIKQIFWEKLVATCEIGQEDKRKVSKEILGKLPKQEEKNKMVVMHEYLKKEENEFRENVEKFLEVMVGKDLFHLGKIKSYHIFTEWVVSIAVKIITEDEKEYVFKSCSNFTQWSWPEVHIEAEVLGVRNKYWIKTPEVYHKSSILFNKKNISYIIMEHIKPTKKIEEENQEKLAYEIGENIARMTKAKGEWFGWINKIEKGTPIWDYDTVERYYNAFNEKYIKTLLEEKIIGESDKEKTYKAIQILKNDFNKWAKPSLNHDDARLHNIFLTDPITIFDPNPRLDHPLYDLAATEIYLSLDRIIPWDQKDSWRKNIQEWYEKIANKKIDNNLLKACIVTRLIRKIYSRSIRNKRKIIQEALEIMNKIELT